MNIAKRYCCLVFLLAIVGAAGGYCYHIQFPPQYVGSLTFELVESFTGESQGQASVIGKHRSTKAGGVYFGDAVLRQATEIGELNKTPGFFGWNADAVVGVLAQAIRVESVREPGSSQRFRVSLRADDVETPERVICAVVAAYERDLQSSFFRTRTQTRDELRSASFEILQRLEQLELAFANFRQSAPWIDGSGRVSQSNRIKADRLLIERQRLIVRRIELESKIKAESDLLVDSGWLNKKLATSGESVLRRSAGGLKSTRPGSQAVDGVFVLGPPDVNPVQPQVTAVSGTNGVGWTVPDHPVSTAMEMERDAPEYNPVAIAAAPKFTKSSAGDTSRLLTSFDGEHSEIVDSTIVMNPMADHSSMLRKELAVVNQELSALNTIFHGVSRLAAEENAVDRRANDFVSQIQRCQAALDKLVSRGEGMLSNSDVPEVRTARVELARLHDRGIASREKSLALGATFGIFVAFLLACLREFSDSTFRSERQLSEHFGLPVIGYLPDLAISRRMTSPPRHPSSTRPAFRYEPDGLFADPIYSVCESICVDGCGSGLKVLQVTSPTSTDDKSVVAANLAIAMARSGKRVLLVDADFNHPKVHRLFGYRIERGTEWLLRHLPATPTVKQVKTMLDEVIIESEFEHLSLVVMGSISSGFSASSHVRQLSVLASLWSKLFDVVIIDSPTMLPATNPMAVTLRGAGILLVVRLTRTAKWRARSTKRRLGTLKPNMLGIVVSGVGSRSIEPQKCRTCWQDDFNRLRLYRPRTQSRSLSARSDVTSTA